MKKSKNLLLISLCTVLSSCGTPPQKPFISLPEKVQSEIGSTEVYLEKDEKIMHANVENPHFSFQYGPGLLWALADNEIMAHRQDCAVEAMGDMQKELEAFNFEEKFKGKLTQLFQNTPWLHTRHINYVKGLTEQELAGILKKENSDSILTCNFKDKLNPQFTVLTGTLYVTLYPTSHKLKKMVKAEDPLKTPIFKFHVSATETLPQAGSDIQENGKIWAQNNGLYLRKALENITQQVLINLEKVLKEPNHLPEV